MVDLVAQRLRRNLNPDASVDGDYPSLASEQRVGAHRFPDHDGLAGPVSGRFLPGLAKQNLF